MSPPRIAYLYSRWPVVSQTFCDSEMLAHEAAGWPLVVATLNPPRDSFRHERLGELRAPVLNPPPPAVLKALRRRAEADGSWPAEMVARHLAAYGPSFQPDVRARNALWLATRLPALGVRHVHVHFANRATHTALFLKRISGLTFSFTPHAQDFLVDLANDELLGEMCREAEFIVAVSDHTLALLQARFPDCASRMLRIYNGVDPATFPAAFPTGQEPLRVVSTGRLLEFKGFHHLIDAVARLQACGYAVQLRIIGEGPWRQALENQVMVQGMSDAVVLLGNRSQDEVKDELAGADVFALACTVDAKGASDILPTAITEAMACGLPVVSTRVAGVPEQVVDGETGLLAEPGDVEGIAACLARLANDRSLAARLGAAGNRRVQEVFSLAVTAASLRERFAALPHLAAPADLPPPPDAWYVVACWPDPDPALQLETGWVFDRNGSIRLLACGAPARPEASQLGPSVDFLPDGIVLEAEWQAAAEARRTFEALRHDLGSAVDGEFFFRCARRALWVAGAATKLGIRRLHGARAEESMVVWLASLVGGPAFSAAFEEGHGLDDRVVGRIRDAAVRVADAAVDDPLLLARPKDVTRRVGPFKFQSVAPAPGGDARRAALDAFFAS